MMQTSPVSMFRPWDDPDPDTIDRKPAITKHPDKPTNVDSWPAIPRQSDVKQENLDEDVHPRNARKFEGGKSGNCDVKTAVSPPVCLDSLAIAYRGLPITAR